MENKGQKLSCCECYLERYQREIAPRLRLIDSWIKSGQQIEMEELADALGLELSAVEGIFPKPRNGGLIREDFLRVLEEGDSEVCRLYQREVACGSPLVYTPEQIAYIYGLDDFTVKRICERLGILEVTGYLLDLVLGEVWISRE